MKGKRAEVAGDRVPGLVGEELQAEGVRGELGAKDKDGEDEEDDREDAAGAEQHEGGEAVVGEAAAAALVRKARIGEGCVGLRGAGAAVPRRRSDGSRLGRRHRRPWVRYRSLMRVEDTILIPVVRL